MNVHVKDRVKGGATIKLGEGDADFEAVFQSLQKVNYQGNFIIQAARSKDNKHDLALLGYYNFTKDYINKYKPSIVVAEKLAERLTDKEKSEFNLKCVCASVKL